MTQEAECQGPQGQFLRKYLGWMHLLWKALWKKKFSGKGDVSFSMNGFFKSNCFMLWIGFGMEFCLVRHYERSQVRKEKLENKYAVLWIISYREKSKFWSVN